MGQKKISLFIAIYGLVKEILKVLEVNVCNSNLFHEGQACMCSYTRRK